MVVDHFGHNTSFRMFKKYIEECIAVQNGGNGPTIGRVVAIEDIEVNNIVVPKGKEGLVQMAEDRTTEYVVWKVDWNGFLWAISMLNDCITNKEHSDQQQLRGHGHGHGHGGASDRGLTGMDQADEVYMKQNTMPSAMRLISQVARYCILILVSYYISPHDLLQFKACT